MRRVILCIIVGVASCSADFAPHDGPIAVLERRPLAGAHVDTAFPLGLSVTLAYFEDAWRAETIASALRESARILGQCGVAITSAELVRLDAPPRFRDFGTLVSRELARTLRLPKPTVYFVAGTRQDPAFEAEAIGRANSSTRPELADTVWVTRGTRDLGIVLAHELAHVLMDSGEHSEEPANLMREDTTPRNTRLDAAQCARLRGTASANGLLTPLAPGSR